MQYLSHSSAQLLLSCEQKYVYRKVVNAEVDCDVSSSPSLNTGSLFHKALEDFKYDVADVPLSYLVKHGQECSMKVDELLGIQAMLRKYDELHKASHLAVAGIEVEETSTEFRGFIDCILLEGTGAWWISDTKTKAAYSESIKSQLATDPQLNLYASHMRSIGAKLGLRVDMFRGCIYRIITKPRHKRKKGESEEEFVSRMVKTLKAVELRLPASLMHMKQTEERHHGFYQRAKQLHEGGTPRQNYSSCMQWNRPCEYWSRCHDKTVTEWLQPGAIEQLIV